MKLPPAWLWIPLAGLFAMGGLLIAESLGFGYCWEQPFGWALLVGGIYLLSTSFRQDSREMR
ncbi:MAG TPA: hypothetical protein DGL25_06390 [Dehalococcoidia bacterium]|nr:hypothetical protein [Dehalococcoidia bacterium]